MMRFFKKAAAALMTAVMITAAAPAAGSLSGYLISTAQAATGASYQVNVSSGYLALRTAPAYADSNIIGELYNTDTVTVTGSETGDYVWVYSSKYGRSGYVNWKYLSGYTSVSTGTYKVSGLESGYLALRTEAAYADANIIGKLYNGDTVTVTGGVSGNYVWVTSASLGKSGYVNSKYLTLVSTIDSTATHKVSGLQSGYLALRTAAAYDSSNEIGKLYNGDYVAVTGSTSGSYVWVLAPSLGKSGYVNASYLTALTTSGSSSSSSSSGSSSTSTSSGTQMTVANLQSGYLALRTAAAYDSSNEIGKLYNGYTVYYYGTSSNGYYWVYSPSLDKSGYVNASYLTTGSSGSSNSNGTQMTVANLQSGYLALRTAAAYDSSNEIGKLYNGYTVYYYGSSSNGYYWVYSPALGLSGYVNASYLK